jgi:nitroreductase
MSTFIDSQKWRYATKKFDTTKKVSDSDIEILKEAIQLSTSSYGLQPYKVLIIENPAVREELKHASWGQTQVTEASHLFVFTAIDAIDDNYIDGYIKNMADTREIALEHLSGFGDFMKSKITNLPQDVKNVWTAKQTYLALGNLLNAAADLKIDVTPMEGFEPEKYGEILGLDAKGLKATLVATVGYRSEEDATQHGAKVRKPITELFETI